MPMTYRVLIVDDQREVSRLLRSALETIEHGLEVYEAPSGEEAILESSRGKFDLLVAIIVCPASPASNSCARSRRATRS